ncbi:uncharacterized protein EDB91DRAFT_588800 [Suillus paluster]|uniref:uncharacterized protein n=1 Tax=Suillus paluster TaxID=48578 RepID=UPI001B85CB02|nr:uncharacterized protein EDB91DRAFT_588800 [Suillus paluster]KAG1734404.1 hypothetical protein EDB91DRAFT_588800 [Suillus paluster]
MALRLLFSYAASALDTRTYRYGNNAHADTSATAAQRTLLPPTPAPLVTLSMIIMIRMPTSSPTFQLVYYVLWNVLTTSGLLPCTNSNTSTLRQPSPAESPYTRTSSSFSAVVQLYARSSQFDTREGTYGIAVSVIHQACVISRLLKALIAFPGLCGYPSCAAPGNYSYHGGLWLGCGAIIFRRRGALATTLYPFLYGCLTPTLGHFLIRQCRHFIPASVDSSGI